jgi:hypothetical protein
MTNNLQQVQKMASETRFTARRPRVARLACQLLLLVLSAEAAVALADTQRMLIESQNFSIPPGGKAQPRAMCLDEASHSPDPSTRFGSAPGSLGDIRVNVPGGKEMSLQQAIDRHIVEVRGTQGYSSVEFRNLMSSGEVKVSVRRNSVVIPDGSHRTDDLRGLPELKASAPMASQEALWHSRSVQQARQSNVPAATDPEGTTPPPVQQAPRN